MGEADRDGSRRSHGSACRVPRDDTRGVRHQGRAHRAADRTGAGGVAAVASMTLASAEHDVTPLEASGPSRSSSAEGAVAELAEGDPATPRGPAAQGNPERE